MRMTGLYAAKPKRQFETIIAFFSVAYYFSLAC